MKKIEKTRRQKQTGDASEQQMHKIRHSLSHLLAMAVLEKYPKTKLAIGPVIENGFYYDFDLPAPLSDKDLPALEKRMKDLIKKRISFKKTTITPPQARNLFPISNIYKHELVEELIREKKSLSTYTSGSFEDLCSGPHVANTKEINPDAFKLTHLAGAYWRGSEKNKMLTRVYGVAFETKQELETYLKNQEEAAKRDHRKLGQELDLFHLDEKVGLGLPLWHPKGALLWRIIEDFWYKKHLEGGYDLVRTPHIGSRALWETSGHWNFYSNSMYPPLEAGQTLEEQKHKERVKESELYLLKPMNCPLHIQVYKNRPRSYRELPFRWAECGTVYRFEKKGELSGLTRVRGFTQDDAHIICAKDRVEEELKRVIDFILFIYRSFGFNTKDVAVYLSLRDPKDKEKYAGNDAGWKFTQDILRKVAKDKKLSFKEEVGEAAFYGPKLDFKIKDALGREWQCSTLQFDFNLPERFDMNFVNAQGKQERAYMLHRALFGSYERFIGLLIEHYAGAFPLWLAPVQTIIIPVSQKQEGYANKLQKTLTTYGIRSQLSSDSQTLGKRIREAQLQKIPYILVVGDKEKKAKSVSVRSYKKGDMGTMEVAAFIKKIAQEIEKKK